MKHSVIKTLIASSLVFGSLSAMASCDKYSCEGVTNTVVSTMKASNEGTFLTFPLGTDAALNCSLVDRNSAKLDSNHPQYKSLHSLLLTAVASNLSLKIAFDTNSPSCSIAEVELKVAE
jgi:hypothetical protein